MNYVKLSKEISYALRHAPYEYELEIDEHGWVNIKQLLSSFKEKEEWVNLSEHDICTMINISDKKRHELFNGKVRALYGHSIKHKIIKKTKKPPQILYHGAARRFISFIKKNGLIPKEHQYVHLSTDIETAFQVGQRRDDKPIILTINALTVWNDGILLYLGNEKVWLADSIKSCYIEFN